MPELRNPGLRAAACRVHARRRARERDCPVPVERLERLCARMRPAFLKPGTERYLLTVHGGGWRWQVVWDEALGCVVTVHPAPDWRQ